MFLFAGFSSLLSLITAPFRWMWRQIAKIFPERDFTVMLIKTGSVRSYHQTSFWRFSKACFWMGLTFWAFWSTYVYIYHRPMLQQRTAELAAVRAQHATHMSDLVAYHRRFVELQREMTGIDNEILQTRKIGEQAADELLRRRISAWGQLDFLQQQLDAMYTRGDYSPDVRRLSELQLDYELVREENRQIRRRNSQLEEAMILVQTADAMIVDRVSQLTTSGIDEINRELRRITGTLTSLGLDTVKLAERANRAENPGVGAAVQELSMPTGIDPKYKELAQQINLWQGLQRTRTMLPLGFPLSGRPRITSPFGMRNDPFTGMPTMHRGVDFAGQIGTPLYAVSPGRVVQAGDRFGYGKTVEVDNGLGFTTLYAHLSEISVRRGDWVRAGDVSGLGGSSGRSTGPHLHYEIRYNGQPFNPYTFIQAKE